MENVQQKLYSAGDNEYRIHCDILDKIAKDRYCNNHLKSQTHNNNNIRNKSTVKYYFFFKYSQTNIWKITIVIYVIY